MKRTAILFSVLLAALTAFVTAPATWKNDPAHSQLVFTVTHLGVSDVSGTFNKFDVTVTSSREDFSDAVFELTADVGSLDTRVERRNNHLKSADFFEVEKFPNLTFKSTSITSDGKDKYKLTGNLTIRDVTKEVTMDLLYRGTIEQGQAKTLVAGFQLTGTINRSDFNVGPNFGPPMISDEVRIKADGEFKRN